MRHVPVSPAGPGGPRQSCTLLAKGGRPLLADVTSLAKSRGWTIETVSVEAGRLDDVFRELTQKEHVRAGGAA